MEGSEKILFTMSLFYFLCGNLVEKGSEGDEARGAALQQTEPGEEIKKRSHQQKRSGGQMPPWWASLIGSLDVRFLRAFMPPSAE